MRDGTLPDEPLNDRAAPYLPAVVQVAPAPDSVPLFPLPDESVHVVPEPSLNPQAPTSPVGNGVALKVAV